MRQIVFVSSNGLVETFSISESAEMERAPPAIFVDICGKIVIVPGECGIFCFSRLIDLSARTMGQSPERSAITSLISAVSVSADLLSQCLKYSSVAALCATWSLFSIDRKPLESTDLPCIALLNAASRE